MVLCGKWVVIVVWVLLWSSCSVMCMLILVWLLVSRVCLLVRLV